jgi:hypothetical protein
VPGCYAWFVSWVGARNFRKFSNTFDVPLS